MWKLVGVCLNRHGDALTKSLQLVLLDATTCGALPKEIPPNRRLIHPLTAVISAAGTLNVSLLCPSRGASQERSAALKVNSAFSHVPSVPGPSIQILIVPVYNEIVSTSQVARVSFAT